MLAMLDVAAGFGQDDIITRGLKNPALAQQDRANKMQQRVTAPKTGSARPQATVKETESESVLGMNLWHMRLADSSSPVKTRGLTHKKLDPTGKREWTPERVTLDEAIPEGELVCLSFESANPGYLYIIDRDVFQDGTKSAPTLRFPTKQIRGGDNLVGPGVLIQIPGPQDDPPAFTVELIRKDQVGILVTLILSRKQLPEISVPPDAIQLNEALVSRYERDYGSGVQMVEDKSMANAVSTLAEKAAASDTAHPLGDKDPLPITLFHRATHPGQPMLASALIKVKPTQ